MRKFNKTIILLILVGLVAFVLGSKSTTEPTKWEYASYWRANLAKPFDMNAWKTPGSTIFGVGLEKLCQKLNINKEENEFTVHDLFNYAGAQGWEFIFMNDDIDVESTIYWFKRPLKD